MSKFLSLAAAALFMIAFAPAMAWGQATGRSGAAIGRLAPPVRLAQYQEPVRTQPIDHQPMDPQLMQQWTNASSPMSTGRPPHRVIEAPAPRHPDHLNHAAAGESHSHHPPHSHWRQRVQPPPATLPGGLQQPTWKTPYSYGYFGASSKRQWSLHHGYRDRYTEWRLK